MLEPFRVLLDFALGVSFGLGVVAGCVGYAFLFLAVFICVVPCFFLCHFLSGRYTSSRFNIEACYHICGGLVMGLPLACLAVILCGAGSPLCLPAFALSFCCGTGWTRRQLFRYCLSVLPSIAFCSVITVSWVAAALAAVTVFPFVVGVSAARRRSADAEVETPLRFTRASFRRVLSACVLMEGIVIICALLVVFVPIAVPSAHVGAKLRWWRLPRVRNGGL